MNDISGDLDLEQIGFYYLDKSPLNVLIWFG